MKDMGKRRSLNVEIIEYKENIIYSDRKKLFHIRMS